MVKTLRWCLMCCLAFTIMLIAKVPEADAAANYLIEINKATNKLILYKNGNKYNTYDVATGKTDDRTPEGTFHMVVKIVQPGWKDIPGGAPNNPLGDRWLGISVNGDRGREYGIHGTNDPASIGTHASNGCVRMRRDDLHELYNMIPETTPVWIHNTPPPDKDSNKKNEKSVWQGDSSYTIQPLSAKAKIKEKTAVTRTGPSTGAFEVTPLKKETPVQITGHSKDWYQVKVKVKNKDKVAYIHKKEVTDVKHNKSTTSPFQTRNGTIETKVNLASIRSAPMMAGVITQRMDKGVKLTLTGENTNWYRVRLTTGYIAYIHKSVANKTNQPAPQQKNITVKTNRVNVRTSASHYAPIQQTVNKGKTFNTIGMNEDWYIIPISPSQTGFIHKTLVQ